MRAAGIMAAIALLTGVGLTAFGDVVTLTIWACHSNENDGFSLQMRESI